MKEPMDFESYGIPEIIEYGVNGFITAGEADKDGVYPEMIEEQDIRDMKDHLIKTLQAHYREELVRELEALRDRVESRSEAESPYVVVHDEIDEALTHIKEEENG